MTPELAVACQRAIQVTREDGQTLGAGRATLHIVAGLGWRRTAAFLSARPNVWLVELAYSIVASNRGLFGRLLFRR